MSKKFQLSIPTPCHENWDKMTPVEKGKFCGSCQKQVVDFSKMSDREIAMFFKKPILSLSKDGSVCGRFMDDQLNRDIEIPKKRIPWIKYFFQFALPAFLVSARATAQGKVLQKNITVQKCVLSNPIMGDIASSINLKKKTFNDPINIIGKVVDEKNNPIPYASVIIKGTTNGTSANQDGTFSLKIQTSNNDSLSFSSVGFETKDIDMKSYQLSDSLIVQLKSLATLGEIVVASNVSTRQGFVTRGVCIKETVFQKVKKKFLTSIIKVFPNPVKSGSSLNIEWKQSEAGDYMLQLFNQAGQLIFSKQLWIDEEARVLNLELPPVAAGSYFLRMTNKHSGKSFSEKIIIQ